MKNKIPFNENGKIYKPQQIKMVLDISINSRSLIANSKGIYFYNIPCSFDIETSSFYKDDYKIQYDYAEKMEIKQNDKKFNPEKLVTMYIWQFGINGNIIIGRTWQEFIDMCDEISDYLQLEEKKRLIVYVHNLSYEFQFISKLFDWYKVFSIDTRKPIYAITSGYIEFRCSYLLSGYSLAKLSSQLVKYHVEKLVGNLDYSKIRHSETPLTQAEIDYCVNDVRVVMAYIQEKIEQDKGIQNIPLTKTGYVRLYCRKNCLYYYNEKGRQKNYDYLNLMDELQISNVKEFDTMQRAFMGGFTHANAFYADTIQENVASFDFTSSYPYVMLSEKFPMSHGVKVEIQAKTEFYSYLENYCCIFDVYFKDIITTDVNENYLSISKCFLKKGVVENNGRIVSAHEIATTITNIDFNIISQCYKWEEMKVNTMYVYKKQYLPTEFVKSILTLYEQKTKLKGVKGKEVEYLKSKEMVNACYGMAVTNPLRDEYIFKNEWYTEKPNDAEKAEMLYKYNHSKNRFLFYPWGIFVTAYARRNLFLGIKAFGNDYIYSDTDSIKALNYEKHMNFINAYNEMVHKKLETACKYHNIPIERMKPKTIKGIEKPLGVWDFEGVYKRFKTLGAKRYMIEEENALTIDDKNYNFSLTVSGVNKFKAIPYLLDKYGEKEIFNVFTNYLAIPPEATGKNLHTYIDYEIKGTVIDYLGNSGCFHEMSGTHLEPTDYNLNLTIMYLQYLKGVQFHEE